MVATFIKVVFAAEKMSKSLAFVHYALSTRITSYTSANVRIELADSEITKGRLFPHVTHTVFAFLVFSHHM